ncbi:coiled-coil domain-containing protein 77-like [Tigriopus californicus]|uniref:coiled-coil domain-containing protein 77-like n=1 Tax=Tigriopus californicus TaxID=6832 RepID=UPI0027DA436E|nr:coiled-coil domain-containing protein 77-like [Tigriopus californicus]
MAENMPPPGDDIRKSRSCPQLQPATADAGSLRTLLQNLPPSREILAFYQAKVQQFEAEEAEWASKLSSHRDLIEANLHLERQAAVKDEEIGRLQTAVQEMRAALVHERKRSQQLETQNDSLKIQELESRQKMLVLLEICGKTDNEITRLLTQAKGKEKQDMFIPERIKDYIRRDEKRLNNRRVQRSAENLRLEVLALESQLLEQEKCHLEQVSMLEEDKRNLRHSQEQIRQSYDGKFDAMSKQLEVLAQTQDELTQELVKSRGKFRKKERQWINEKEVFLRKLQFIQHYGCDQSPDEAGFYTGQRSAFRLGGEHQFRRRIEKITAELSEQKQLVENYKSRLLISHVESENLREQSQSAKDILRKRTKAMLEQVEVLKDRYDALEQRKRKEAEGYQADVIQLQQKIKKIETQLVSTAISKNKEHDYIKTIKAYEKELDEIKRSLKKNPQWLN